MERFSWGDGVRNEEALQSGGEELPTYNKGRKAN
jgi:hypothetical protein